MRNPKIVKKYAGPSYVGPAKNSLPYLPKYAEARRQYNRVPGNCAGDPESVAGVEMGIKKVWKTGIGQAIFACSSANTCRSVGRT